MNLFYVILLVVFALAVIGVVGYAVFMSIRLLYFRKTRPELQQLDSGDKSKRLQAILSLAEKNQPWGMKPIEKVLWIETDIDLLVAAHKTYSQLGGDPTDILLRRLRPSVSQRWTQSQSTAAEALAHIGENRAIEVLCGLLASESEQVRAGAQKGILTFGPAATNPLVQTLAHENVDVRQATIEILAQMPASENIRGALVGRLALERDDSIKRLVAGVLGEIGDRQGSKALITMCKDSDSQNRQAATKALGKIGDGEGAIDALIPLLIDEAYLVRKETANSLSLLGWQPRNDEEMTSLMIAEGQWQDMAAIGEPATETLVKYYRSQRSSSGERAETAWALIQVGDENTIEWIYQEIQNGNAASRQEFLESTAARASSSRARELLTRMKSDASEKSSRLIAENTEQYDRTDRIDEKRTRDIRNEREIIEKIDELLDAE